MRTPRKLLLPQPSATVHKFWRAHNKAFLLQNSEVKRDYLTILFKSLSHKSVSEHVKIHAYCIMSNHTHELTSYTNTSESLSVHMRVAHGRFGQLFNKIHNRQGAVAYDRPKTPLIEPNDYHLMVVQFYIEANPLRAGMVKNLASYPYSSYRFYAFGIKDEFTSQLIIPDWYLKLGSTPKERQKKYRILFSKYLKETIIRHPEFTYCKYIGDIDWVLLQHLSFIKKLNKDPPPE